MRRNRPHLQTPESPSTASPQRIRPRRTLTPPLEPPDEQLTVEISEDTQPGSAPNITLTLSTDNSTTAELIDSEESLPVPDVAANLEIPHEIENNSNQPPTTDTDCLTVEAPKQPKKDAPLGKRRASLGIKHWRPHSPFKFYKKKKMSASRERAQSEGSTVPSASRHTKITAVLGKSKSEKSIFNAGQKDVAKPKSKKTTTATVKEGLENDVETSPLKGDTSQPNAPAENSSVAEETDNSESGTNGSPEKSRESRETESQRIDCPPQKGSSETSLALIRATKPPQDTTVVKVVNVKMPRIKARRHTVTMPPEIAARINRQPLYQPLSLTSRLLRSVAVQTSMNWYHIMPMHKEAAACNLRELVNVAVQFERQVLRLMAAQNSATHNSERPTIHLNAVSAEISTATTTRSAETELRWFELVQVLESPGRRFHCRVALPSTKASSAETTERSTASNRTNGNNTSTEIISAEAQLTTRNIVELVTAATQYELQATINSIAVGTNDPKKTSKADSENQTPESEILTTATQTAPISTETQSTNCSMPAQVNTATQYDLAPSTTNAQTAIETAGDEVNSLATLCRLTMLMPESAHTSVQTSGFEVKNLTDLCRLAMLEPDSVHASIQTNAVEVKTQATLTDTTGQLTSEQFSQWETQEIKEELETHVPVDAEVEDDDTTSLPSFQSLPDSDKYINPSRRCMKSVEISNLNSILIKKVFISKTLHNDALALFAECSQDTDNILDSDALALSAEVSECSRDTDITFCNEVLALSSESRESSQNTDNIPPLQESSNDSLPISDEDNIINITENIDEDLDLDMGPSTSSRALQTLTELNTMHTWQRRPNISTRRRSVSLSPTVELAMWNEISDRMKAKSANDISDSNSTERERSNITSNTDNATDKLIRAQNVFHAYSRTKIHGPLPRTPPRGIACVPLNQLLSADHRDKVRQIKRRHTEHRCVISTASNATNRQNSRASGSSKPLSPIPMGSQSHKVSSTRDDAIADMEMRARRQAIENLYNEFYNLYPDALWTGRFLREPIDIVITMHRISGNTDSISDCLDDPLSISEFCTLETFQLNIESVVEDNEAVIALVYILPQDASNVRGYEEIFQILHSALKESEQVAKLKNNAMQIYLYPIKAGESFHTGLQSAECIDFLDNAHRPALILGVVLYSEQMTDLAFSQLFKETLERATKELKKGVGIFAGFDSIGPEVNNQPNTEETKREATERQTSYESTTPPELAYDGDVSQSHTDDTPIQRLHNGSGFFAENETTGCADTPNNPNKSSAQKRKTELSNTSTSSPPTTEITDQSIRDEDSLPRKDSTKRIQPLKKRKKRTASSSTSSSSSSSPSNECDRSKMKEQAHSLLNTATLRAHTVNTTGERTLKNGTVLRYTDNPNHSTDTDEPETECERGTPEGESTHGNWGSDTETEHVPNVDLSDTTSTLDESTNKKNTTDEEPKHAPLRDSSESNSSVENVNRSDEENRRQSMSTCTSSIDVDLTETYTTSLDGDSQENVVAPRADSTSSERADVERQSRESGYSDDTTAETGTTSSLLDVEGSNSRPELFDSATDSNSPAEERVLDNTDNRNANSSSRNVENVGRSVSTGEMECNKVSKQYLQDLASKSRRRSEEAGKAYNSSTDSSSDSGSTRDHRTRNNFKIKTSPSKGNTKKEKHESKPARENESKPISRSSLSVESNNTETSRATYDSSIMETVRSVDSGALELQSSDANSSRTEDKTNVESDEPITDLDSTIKTATKTDTEDNETDQSTGSGKKQRYSKKCTENISSDTDLTDCSATATTSTEEKKAKQAKSKRDAFKRKNSSFTLSSSIENEITLDEPEIMVTPENNNESGKQVVGETTNSETEKSTQRTEISDENSNESIKNLDRKMYVVNEEESVEEVAAEPVEESQNFSTEQRSDTSVLADSESDAQKIEREPNSEEALQELPEVVTTTNVESSTFTKSVDDAATSSQTAPNTQSSPNRASTDSIFREPTERTNSPRAKKGSTDVLQLLPLTQVNPTTHWPFPQAEGESQSYIDSIDTENTAENPQQAEILGLHGDITAANVSAPPEQSRNTPETAEAIHQKAGKNGTTNTPTSPKSSGDAHTKKCSDDSNEEALSVLNALESLADWTRQATNDLVDPYEDILLLFEQNSNEEPDNIQLEQSPQADIVGKTPRTVSSQESADGESNPQSESDDEGIY